jgi:putative ATP-binding cassette transporter
MTELLQLCSFLLRTSPSVALCAVVLGLVAGSASAGVLAMANMALDPHAESGWNSLVVFGAVCLVSVGTNLGSHSLLIKLAQDASYDLRRNLAHQILRTPLYRLEELGNPRLLASLADDIPVIANGLLVIPVLCINVAVVVGCLSYLGILSVTMLLIVCGFLIAGVGGYHWLGTQAAKSLTKSRNEEDALFGHFRTLLEGIKELQLDIRQQARFLHRLDATAHQVRDGQISGLTRHAVAFGWGELLFFAALGVLIFALFEPASTAVQTGSVLVLIYLLSPIEGIMSILPALSQSIVALRKVETIGIDLAAVGRSAAVGSSDAQASSSWRSLEIIGITYTYLQEPDGNAFVLGPLHLCLSPGEMVFFIGGNGGGKTTFAKVLTGLYAPESGQIRLDGRLVTDETRDWYREHFAAVFQEFHVFPEIARSDDGGVHRLAEEYLSLLQLDHKVTIKHGVLSTTALSRGQRKRLALLSACLADRPVYVLDEWASDQDPIFKSVFYTRILGDLRSKGKAVVVITHDERYFHLADRCIRIENGQFQSMEVPSCNGAR